MFFVKGMIKNVFTRAGYSNNGQSYPAKQVLQIEGEEMTKDGETKFVNYDLSAPPEWNDCKELQGKKLMLPVKVSVYNGNMNVFILPNAPRPNLTKAA